jgi:hypothetical protein
MSIALANQSQASGGGKGLYSGNAYLGDYVSIWKAWKRRYGAVTSLEAEELPE